MAGRWWGSRGVHATGAPEMMMPAAEGKFGAGVARCGTNSAKNRGSRTLRAIKCSIRPARQDGY